MISSGLSISIQAPFGTYFLISSESNDQQASDEPDQWVDVYCFLRMLRNYMSIV